MKNLILTIIIYKNFLIRIKPLVWYIVPIWHTDSGIGSGSKDVWVKIPSYKLEAGYQGKWLRRQYRVGMIIHWLCIELQFTYWRDTEVAEIYSANYLCDEDPQWREKYEQLDKTGYFN